MGVVDMLTIVAVVAGLIVLYLIIRTLIDAVKEAVSSPAGKKVADFMEGTVTSAGDLLHAGATGNLPATPGPNQDDAAVNYFASVHDLLAHPMDSLGVLWGN